MSLLQEIQLSVVDSQHIIEKSATFHQIYDR
jgi:hypothetical protein